MRHSIYIRGNFFLIENGGTINKSGVKCWQTGDQHSLGPVHLHLHPVVLPEDASGHARAGDREPFREHRERELMGGGQNAHERSRLLFLHRVRVQRLVHPRVPNTYHGKPEPLRVHQELGEPDRHGGHAELLPRPGPPTLRVPPRERGHPRVLEHNTYHEAVQAHPPLVRPQDPHPNVPRIRQRVDPSRLLPGPRHRHIRKPGLLRGTHPVQPEERLQEHTARPVVGPRNDDHGRLRGHGAQDVRGHVRGRPLRPGRCTDHRPAGARDRQQLCDVLQSHAGASQAAQEEAPRTPGRAAEGEERAVGRRRGGSGRPGAAGLHPAAHAPGRARGGARRPRPRPRTDARDRVHRRPGAPEQTDERHQDQSSQGRFVRHENR